MLDSKVVHWQPGAGLVFEVCGCSVQGLGFTDLRVEGLAWVRFEGLWASYRRSAVVEFWNCGIWLIAGNQRFYCLKVV